MLRKRTLCILITSLLIIEITQVNVVYAPSFREYSSESFNIESLLTNSPPNIDGIISENEWDYTPSLILEHGYMMFQNDASNFYILLDLTEDTVDDPLISEAPWGDYFSLSFDVNTNSEIDNIDVKYGIHPITHELGISFFQGPGMVTTIHDTQSYLAKGFGTSINSMNEHRIWELAINLDEIHAVPGSLIKLGLRTNSQNPEFTELLPENLDQTFISFIPIKLAKTETNIPTSGNIITNIETSIMDSTVFAVSGPWETYGSEPFIDLSNHGARGFIQFDLSSIPQGSKISSATLMLYYGYNGDDPVGRTYMVYRVIQPWTEEGVTWEKYDGINEWTVPGGDYTSLGAYPASVPRNVGEWIHWDLTLIARDWIEEGQANYGLLVKDANEEVQIINPPFYIAYIHSRENPETEFHPKLRISYVPPQPSIKIYVKDTDGTPINRAEVTSITQPSGQTTLAGTTGPEGYIIFEEVKSGSYTFLASSEEYESNSESITVSQGEDLEKTILLEKKPWEIPGFPIESVVIGLALVILLLWVHK
jgi:hypothetical protein